MPAGRGGWSSRVLTKVVARALQANMVRQALARLAKALGHPARVAILRLLIARTECICGEICEEIPLAQSTISQHLKLLKNAGLIVGEVDGPRVCYCINTARLERLKALVAAL